MWANLVQPKSVHRQFNHILSVGLKNITLDLFVSHFMTIPEVIRRKISYVIVESGVNPTLAGGII